MIITDKKIYLYIEAACDRGSYRKKNEDLILVGNKKIREAGIEAEIKLEPDSAPLLIAVADGIGGHKDGEVASDIVITRLRSFVKKLPKGLSHQELKAIFEKETTLIHNYLKRRSNKALFNLTMGATVTAVLFYHGKIYYFNAGDSRLYRFRRGYLRVISTDHSAMEFEGSESNSSNIIFNSIGGGQKSFLDFDYIGDILMDEDVLFLCTDGLSDMLEDFEIESLLSEERPVEDFISEALKAGGNDNISAVIIRIYKE